jgi:hypothetical protein
LSHFASNVRLGDARNLSEFTLAHVASLVAAPPNLDLLFAKKISRHREIAELLFDLSQAREITPRRDF